MTAHRLWPCTERHFAGRAAAMQIEPGKDRLGRLTRRREPAGKIAVALAVLKEDIAMLEARPQARLAVDDDIKALLFLEHRLHVPCQGLAAGHAVGSLALRGGMAACDAEDDAAHGAPI